MTTQPDKKLVLADGTQFYGHGFGANRTAICNIVFNTSVVGYQEILSDPSYTNQLVVMTYPVIGNYGIADEDFESRQIGIGGLVVREYCTTPSNFRFTQTIAEIMEECNIPGISGIDTRALTRHLRDKGAMRAAIVDASMSVEEAVALIENTPAEENVVAKVSCRKRWYSRTPNHKYDVVVVDCGVKRTIIEELNRRGCNVVIVPYNTPIEEIRGFNPHGILISNGPGAPTELPEVVSLIREFKGELPMMGISLGHLLVCLAYGAQCDVNPTGNRSVSRSVRNAISKRIETTGMALQYVVNRQSLEGTALQVSHTTVVGDMVVGVECRKDRVFSVQYNPEGAPGANDSTYLFDKFIKLMEDSNNA
ncbi:MAG: glutamine-hydrolyzing carbamoyl-phosphate synthase small subunit [Alistipes sp.]|nr:glutamine-hydrolyzing carbamoyl-phosphate synthase small subunit [Alistipes sp.]